MARDTHRVWSWDANHRTWLEVAQGSRQGMIVTLERKRAAAAKHLPSARFCMTTMQEVPTGEPDE